MWGSELAWWLLQEPLLSSKDPSGSCIKTLQPWWAPCPYSCPSVNGHQVCWDRPSSEIPSKKAWHRGRLTRFCCSLHWLWKASFYTITEILLKKMHMFTSALRQGCCKLHKCCLVKTSILSSWLVCTWAFRVRQIISWICGIGEKTLKKDINLALPLLDQIRNNVFTRDILVHFCYLNVIDWSVSIGIYITNHQPQALVSAKYPHPAPAIQ